MFVCVRVDELELIHSDLHQNRVQKMSHNAVKSGKGILRKHLLNPHRFWCCSAQSLKKKNIYVVHVERVNFGD